MNKGNVINLSTVADGAIDERFDQAMREVLANIANLNTDPKKKRKIVMTVTLTGNKDRQLTDTSFQIKTTLAPAVDVETVIMIDFDENGVTGNELKSGAVGQTYIDQEGDISDDKGLKIVQIEKSGNAVQFK